VHQHPSGTEEIDKRRVPAAQMIYPNRRINQDHAGRDRRRGGAFSAPSLPPSRAKRRALSRSISALSASRTKLDFSVKAGKGLSLGNELIIQSNCRGMLGSNEHEYIIV